MQGLVNRLATCSTDDGDNKEGETTRGHWLEHHEHSASSVATLRGPDGDCSWAYSYRRAGR